MSCLAIKHRPNTVGVEVSKQPFDIALGGVAVGGSFDSDKDAGQIGIQAFVGVGIGRDIDEQLAGIDEVALGLDSIVPYFRWDRQVEKRCVVDAFVSNFDVGSKVLADEALEQACRARIT